MNLVRNLRKWKFNSIKKSEICVVNTLKKENLQLQAEMTKYKTLLKEKGQSVETDKSEKENKLA